MDGTKMTVEEYKREIDADLLSIESSIHPRNSRIDHIISVGNYIPSNTLEQASGIMTIPKACIKELIFLSFGNHSYFFHDGKRLVKCNLQEF